MIIENCSKTSVRKRRRTSQLLLVIIGAMLQLNAETFYVKADGGSDENGGKSPDAAFSSIQKAIDSSTDGDRIVVYDGIYDAITCDNGSLVIESVNGPEYTIIDGEGATSAADFGSSSGSSGEATTNTVLRGFTLCNGFAYMGGGIFAGTVEHCVISNNVAYAYGGGCCSTKISDSLIVCNTSYNYGGGTAGGEVRRCVITKNEAYCGGGTFQSMTCNSLLTYNVATGGGGGSYQNTLLAYCTFFGNKAEQGGGMFSGYVNSCIFYGNSANAAADTCYAEMYYSCAADNANLYGDGKGNVAVDPCFVDAAAGDFHLQTDSPCINAGSIDDAFLAEGPDLDGNPRKRDGRPDMGAYEYQPVVDPGYVEIWGEWSSAEEQYYAVPESVSSWDELARALWQARDVYVKSGTRTEVPPTEGGIILSLGAISIPESLMVAEPAIATEIEHGVAVWRLRVCEDPSTCSLMAVAGNTTFELSSQPSYLANAWVETVYGMPPAWLDAGETDAWYAARMRSRIGWFVTLVPKSDWAAYCANRAAEAESATTNEEAPLIVKGFSPDSATAVHQVAIRSLVPGGTRLWSKDSLSAENWNYNGYSLQAAGTTAAGIHSVSNRTFVLASFTEYELDSDGDGIPDLMEEKVYGTNPHKTDTSGDGISDWEKVFHYDLNPRVRDTSGDGIHDDEKIAAGADPRVAVSPAQREAARGSIRYYYDDDDRLTGTWVGLGGASATTVLTPAGNPKEIRERDAVK